MKVEFVRFQPEVDRARQALEALAAACPVPCLVSSAYTGAGDVLVLWGPGAHERRAAIDQHVRAGGHAVALDGAYWHRDQKFRISIDAAHPQAWVMRRPLVPARYEADRPTTANVWDPSGPVLVAGVGAKAAAQYGHAVIEQWEATQVARARKAGLRVLYRPKPGGRQLLGVEQAQVGPIDRALVGCSAVVTWHSNVAVDAIRMGIPAVCRDGAAAAICDGEWRPGLTPLPAEWRQRFLQNLAWFQWSPAEAAECWTFLEEALA